MKRWKLVLHNTVTGERRSSLLKHAEMLSEREAKAIVKRTRGKLLENWEYLAEPHATPSA